ncbi:transketolase [Candidatus Roizmanbacteria bacterium]|nr:transketolase [Candidatus Roizmanbacteria bacterium]
MDRLEKLARLVRYFILISTTSAGSGHPTSSLSATELMIALLFGGIFRFDLDNPDYPNNDRLIFSKGHASPLFYALYAAAGKVIEKDLKTLRKFGSPLEGHPTPKFRYTEVSTGSLGQGLSIGLGMALNAKYVDKLPYRTYVLLGDSEMAEGSVWEAIQIAANYKLDNLVGIIDVNRLGQRGETMYGHDIKEYGKRIAAFGWETVLVENGHSFDTILDVYKKLQKTKGKPTMIIARTIKGKGVSFLENKDGWHGKALSADELKIALKELGAVDLKIRGTVKKPQQIKVLNSKSQIPNKLKVPSSKFQNVYKANELVATRKAYGNALVRIFPKFQNMVVLDGEVSNSTYAELFKKEYPERFFEMYIAEQNMAGTALGLSRRGKIPFVSTFAAFFTRAFDQIRMSQYSSSNIKFVGSHAGVSIGEDGASQMGLEDISMFRTLRDGVVLYPSDAISCEKLVEEAAKHHGNVYIRTTRKDTPILYDSKEEFPIGGSKVHIVKSQKSKIGIIAAGITLHEALAAQKELLNESVETIVIDCYSIKPIDKETLRHLARNLKAFIVVEDHYEEGGIAEAVRCTLFDIPVITHSLAVHKTPRSGKADELLNYEEISKGAIIKKVREIL